MRAAVRVPAVVAAAAVLANHGAAGTPGQTLMARIIPAPGSLIVLCGASACAVVTCRPHLWQGPRESQSLNPGTLEVVAYQG